ncbi:DUF3551 domain-containing protein [Bradyrhizobium sp. WSM 1704]|uniref:DUF3551 domain-containing protein n=1 Tax=Bradyrhizobium semiaridum TaxID=2821404 RepID=UPI001CE33FA5|nr:DUF3551 domain-containing protein [Bradyrhizobium semiaridum]MCA6124548.1 DUF3551 domain-containing protein [Bradyrhizobium semiaridum]
MSRLLLIMLSATAISVAAGSAASAGPRHHHHERAYVYAPNDRYCLQGRIWGYPGNCQFATYEQCAVTASGTDAYCDINPQYAFARQQYYR